MNPYGVNIDGQTLMAPMASLKILYDGMPQTTGCENCHEANGDESKWCCRYQNPSMFYIEFLYIWEEIQDNWSKKDRSELMLRAVRNYLDNSLSKGCIFYDDECKVYDKRPLMCRLYGVIPKESWDNRWEALKERQGDKFEARSQCPLVTPHPHPQREPYESSLRFLLYRPWRGSSF